MITWTILKNHLLEVGLTQNWETMAFRMFTIVDLFYFNICEDPHEYKSIEIAFGWGPGHIWLHTSIEGPWPLHDFGGVLGRPLNPFFWALTISWSRLLARVWSETRKWTQVFVLVSFFDWVLLMPPFHIQNINRALNRSLLDINSTLKWENRFSFFIHSM